MSQTVSSLGEFGGAVPADLKCGFCKKPIQGEFYRTLNRFACAKCAAEVQGVIDRNILTPQHFVLAAVAGLLVGLGCAVGWGVITHETQREFGIVAWLIGFAVGRTVHVASGKRRGTALQWLAAGLSVVGIASGKVVLLSWAMVDAFNQRGIVIRPASVARAVTFMLTHDFTSLFSGFDLLWMFIAVFTAFRLCKAARITIGGPFPVAPPQQTDLQFHTIEPAEPGSTPEQP